MKRAHCRAALTWFLTVGIMLLLSAITLAAPKAEAKAGVQMGGKMIGMYVHQHWPYKHPYAARTWTLADWRGYAGGLKQLGYNTLLIWPMLEIMPDPLTPSDKAALTRIGKVVDMLHNELDMRAYIVLCPNIIADDTEASRVTFQARHYYYVETLVNPADPVAVDKMIQRRETLLRPLANADGIAMIDSDPGGYPGSTIPEFVHLLEEHRKMFDRVRPGIELIYWMHAGWRGWSRLYETGRLTNLGNPIEQQEALTQLNQRNPQPWGIANGLQYAQKLGIEAKVMIFNYGKIELEPAFPLTNFGGTGAYEGGQAGGPRGVMGNAQTHCVQLPNTFAFARGATGQTLNPQDYEQFADDLILGHGATIVEAWKALQSKDSPTMLMLATRLESIATRKPTAGKLKGLLFGSPKRFLTDLVMQLRYQAAHEEFCSDSENNRETNVSFARFVQAAETWQHQHGFENMWWEPRLHQALRKLNRPEINAALDVRHEVVAPLTEGKTMFEQVRANFAAIETYTPRLLSAMQTARKALSVAQ